MKEVIVGQNIYPDLTEEILEGMKSNLEKKFGISIQFLLEDGMCFSVPDDFEVMNYPGICYFKKNGVLILTYVENFQTLDFLDTQGETILRIPTLEDSIF